MVKSDERRSPQSYGLDNESTREPLFRKDDPSWMFWKKRRYVVGFMAFLGFFNTYALRVNMSIAIVAMTQNRTITLENNTIVSIGPEFEWSNEIQGYILSSFFYGYITTQLLGGYLAAKIGGKWIFGTGIAVTAALTVITPWLAKAHVYLLLAVRIIEGVFEGVTYPCIHAIWAKWAPPLERSRLATIAFSGSYAGTVVAMPLSAFLANTFGWPSIFYFFGVLGLIWYLAWVIIVTESPEEDPKISAEELAYITESLSKTKGKHLKVPWKAALTSLPVWAIVVSHFSENWGFYTLLTQLPKYLKESLDYDLGKSGFLSGLPYLAMAIMTQFAGHWADWFQVKGILTTTQVRKFFNCGAFLGQTIFMMAAAYWSDRIGTVFCLTMAVGLGAFAWAGFSVNHLDIAPQYASVLMGIGNTFATLPGIVSPILTGYIVSSPPTSLQWQSVFYISSGIYLFGAVIYGTFASGELQPWAIESESLKQSKSNKRSRNTYQLEEVLYDNKSYEKDAFD